MQTEYNDDDDFDKDDFDEEADEDDEDDDEESERLLSLICPHRLHAYPRSQC